MHGPNGTFPLHPNPKDNHQSQTKGHHANVQQTNMAMAAISLSGLRFLPGPDDFGFLEGKNKPKKKRPRGKQSEPNPPDRHNPGRNGTQNNGTQGNRPAPECKQNTPDPLGNTKHSNFQAKCPMAKVPGLNAAIGGLLQLTTQPHRLSCPTPIVKLRAALAKTEAVRNLRPKQVPFKILAVAGAGTAVNVPLGMWREHTEKFSLAWFLAVHASLPFVISLRKACIMPRYAVLFTITAAVMGQALGARMERERMRRVKPTLQRCGTPTASTIDRGGHELFVT